MKRPTPKANSPLPPPLHPSPMAIVGAILAQRGNPIDRSSESRRSCCEKALDAPNSHSSACADNDTV